MSPVERAVVAALVVHVLAVVAFLVAVAAGGGVRLLLALGGAALVTVVWLAWARRVADDTSRRGAPPGPVHLAGRGTPHPVREIA